MEFGFELYVMSLMKSTKKRNNERNRTVKSGNNQDAWRVGKLPVLGNIGSKHH